MIPGDPHETQALKLPNTTKLIKKKRHDGKYVDVKVPLTEEEKESKRKELEKEWLIYKEMLGINSTYDELQRYFENESREPYILKFLRFSKIAASKIDRLVSFGLTGTT